jgi:hypothetical protein
MDPVRDDVSEPCLKTTLARSNACHKVHFSKSFGANRGGVYALRGVHAVHLLIVTDAC